MRGTVASAEDLIGPRGVLRFETVLTLPGGKNGIPNLNTYINAGFNSSGVQVKLERQWRGEGFVQAEAWIKRENAGIQPLFNRSLIVLKTYFENNIGSPDVLNAWFKASIDGMELAGLFRDDTGASMNIWPAWLTGFDKARPRYEYWLYSEEEDKTETERPIYEPNKFFTMQTNGWLERDPGPGPNYLDYKIQEGSATSPKHRALVAAYLYRLKKAGAEPEGWFKEYLETYNPNPNPRPRRSTRQAPQRAKKERPENKRGKPGTFNYTLALALEKERDE